MDRANYKKSVFDRLGSGSRPNANPVPSSYSADVNYNYDQRHFEPSFYKRGDMMIHDCDSTRRSDRDVYWQRHQHDYRGIPRYSNEKSPTMFKPSHQLSSNAQLPQVYNHIYHPNNDRSRQILHDSLNDLDSQRYKQDVQERHSHSSNYIDDSRVDDAQPSKLLPDRSVNKDTNPTIFSDKTSARETKRKRNQVNRRDAQSATSKRKKIKSNSIATVDGLPIKRSRSRRTARRRKKRAAKLLLESQQVNGNLLSAPTNRDKNSVSEKPDEGVNQTKRSRTRGSKRKLEHLDTSRRKTKLQAKKALNIIEQKKEDEEEKTRKTSSEDEASEAGSMVFEAISDEELEDFFEDIDIDDVKNTDLQIMNQNHIHKKFENNTLTIEQLNGMISVWGDLIESEKQSKVHSLATERASKVARSRFELSNYLQTVEISPELAGPTLYELVTKIASSSI